jgi:hypothetical protein
LSASSSLVINDVLSMASELRIVCNELLRYCLFLSEANGVQSSKPSNESFRVASNKLDNSISKGFSGDWSIFGITGVIVWMGYCNEKGSALQGGCL